MPQRKRLRELERSARDYRGLAPRLQSRAVLDEGGELPIRLQPKLLRALQEKEHRRLGGVRTIKFDGRMVAATNRDLHRRVKEGEFREDLLFRLNVIPIELPPLRERHGDVPLLADSFLESCSER